MEICEPDHKYGQLDVSLMEPKAIEKISKVKAKEKKMVAKIDAKEKKDVAKGEAKKVRSRKRPKRSYLKCDLKDRTLGMR